ncbi:2TM domain-containing protein [Flavobacterium sp. N1719]|uniref:2TM domain-containing protein n=1 Tax=Flavobacterium sp. N1719 TaxID=2885633 RepID=UPI00222226C4|nr:2TM domain-containing protein [Flavobacterium sp. N1719]
MTPEDQFAYEAAQERVKKIKGLYTHTFVYAIVNALIIFSIARELPDNETLFQPGVFSTAFFWGIGLLGHALSVIIPEFILGKDWEERKIQQYMEEEKKK